MKKCAGIHVCLIHACIPLYSACFIRCETTMTPYYATLRSRNATNRVNKASSIWSFFIDHSTQEIYSTCNAIKNSLYHLRKVKDHCWACPAGKLIKLCCSSTAVTCPTHPRAPKGTIAAHTSCWRRVLPLFIRPSTGQ